MGDCLRLYKGLWFTFLFFWKVGGAEPWVAAVSGLPARGQLLTSPWANCPRSGMEQGSSCKCENTQGIYNRKTRYSTKTHTHTIWHPHLSGCICFLELTTADELHRTTRENRGLLDLHSYALIFLEWFTEKARSTHLSLLTPATINTWMCAASLIASTFYNNNCAAIVGVLTWTWGGCQIPELWLSLWLFFFLQNYFYFQPAWSIFSTLLLLSLFSLLSSFNLFVVYCDDTSIF